MAKRVRLAKFWKALFDGACTGTVQEDQGFASLGCFFFFSIAAIIRVTTHETWGTVVFSNRAHIFRVIWTLTL